MKNKKIMALLLSTVLAFSLIGCGNKDKKDPGANGDKPKVETKGPSGTLVTGVKEMSGNFNPAYYSSAYDANVIDMVFDKLTARDVKGGIITSAAESWEVSKDAREITFKMRKDMVFSDGEKVTANDVVFTYKVISDPSYTGRYGSNAKDLVGYTEYSKGETTEFKGVTAIDDYTVKFSFVDPLRTNLENCGFPIMAEHYYGKDFKVGDTSKVEAITTTPMGSGPYILEKFQEKEFASLKRNLKYYGEGYKIENVVCKFVTDTTDIVELTSKNVDLLPGVIEPNKINESKSKDFLTFNTYDRSGYGYTKFNCESGPTADKKVRQALYYSFNIKEFVNSFYKDEVSGDVLASVQYHPFSQMSWAIDDTLLKEMTEYDFNLEKAKSLLDEAGWKVGPSGFREKDGKVMELNIAAMPDHSILNTLIPMWQRDWGEGLKVKLNIAYLEFNTMLDYVIYNSDENVDKWSIYFMATSITTPDPDSLYSDFHSAYIGSGKDNTNRYKNPEIDKLLDEAKSIVNIDEAKPYYKKIAKILNEDAPIMPVYANSYFDLYNKKIKDLKTSPFLGWVQGLKDAYIQE
ncbi:MAG: ABC transporter substrate-binding protein [Clostridium sp.]|uniref:ABC transporter substrate-binding protein n=1 Tax=Clostridium sp. TaxID=1506 RepID=UPI0030540780